ncbi:MAG: terpene cyclase/mutase family protein [Actinomycetota bacterium]|nr:terpene cyclase/mutase family protein [Actinomycetota bacterium]
MIKKSIIIATALSILALLLLPSFARAERNIAESAISFLKSHQNTDGGFSEPGESSEVFLTCWALVAGSVAGKKPLSWASNGQTAETFISKLTNGATALLDIELITLAVSSSGENPRDIDGTNMVSIIRANVDKDGGIGQTIKEHCWGLIALRSADETISSNMVKWLISKQREDGSWADSGKDVTEVTSLAIEALVATGEADSNLIRPSLLFLRNRMNKDGGFAGQSGKSESILTSNVIRAIYAAGDDPNLPAWTFEGHNPLNFLESLAAQDGHFFYAPEVESQPSLATAIAVPSLLGKHLPSGVKSARASLGGEGGAAVDDLGNTGAGMKPGENTKSRNRLRPRSSLRSKATGKRMSWFSDFWLFVFCALSYVVVLIIAMHLLRRSEG